MTKRDKIAAIERTVAAGNNVMPLDLTQINDLSVTSVKPLVLKAALMLIGNKHKNLSGILIDKQAVVVNGDQDLMIANNSESEPFGVLFGNDGSLVLDTNYIKHSDIPKACVSITVLASASRRVASLGMLNSDGRTILTIHVPLLSTEFPSYESLIPDLNDAISNSLNVMKINSLKKVGRIAELFNSLTVDVTQYASHTLFNLTDNGSDVAKIIISIPQGEKDEP